MGNKQLSSMLSLLSFIFSSAQLITVRSAVFPTMDLTAANTAPRFATAALSGEAFFGANLELGGFGNARDGTAQAVTELFENAYDAAVSRATTTPTSTALVDVLLERRRGALHIRIADNGASIGASMSAVRKRALATCRRGSSTLLRAGPQWPSCSRCCAKAHQSFCAEAYNLRPAGADSG